MTDRRAFITLVGGSILAGPLTLEAQQSAKGHRIGVLIGSSESFVAPYFATFRQALRALGYVEGGNIAIEYRYADGDYNRLPALAADLVRRTGGSNSNSATRASARRPTPTATFSLSATRQPSKR